MADRRRRLPSVDFLLRSPAAARASQRFGRAVVRLSIRDALEEARGNPDAATASAVLERAIATAARASMGLAPVINATGVVLHTNLGRAPLPPEAARAVARAASSYNDLEADRESGRRGRRGWRSELLLRALTGAEDALVVNNNAAALLLALMALAPRKEVLVSRGELIEIGGEFRLPEIMAASGAKLVEVGTTNRTRLADYERAMSTRTALILAVHPSNFRVTGFAESPALGALAQAAHAAGVPLLHDTGSGLLAPTAGVPGDEPTASGSLAAGADLVCFSGDKLLGGPQAGLVVGRAEPIAKMRRHPAARALRVDALTLAALESVLHLHATGRSSELPVWRSLTTGAGDLARRARVIAGSIEGARAARGESVAGGGALPGWSVPSHVIRLPSPDPGRLAGRLRSGRPAVFARVDASDIVIDLRTVDPSEDERLTRAVRYAQAQEP